MLWNSAAPRVLVGAAGGSAEPVATATGNNAFSASRLDAMQMVWDKIAARKAKLDQETTQRDTESSAFAMREAIAKLRLTQSPVEFWLAMMNEQPRGASAEQRAAHMLFCKSAADISSIVGHTCGVERAGKAYKQVLGPLRKAMDPIRASKAIFIYSNFNLSQHKQSTGDAFGAFASSDASTEALKDATAEKDMCERHVLRRGNLIFNDTGEGGGSDGSEGEEEKDPEQGGEGGEGEGEEEEAEEGGRAVVE
eukprot:7390181-Prymnesium_polylepis.1